MDSLTSLKFDPHWDESSLWGYSEHFFHESTYEEAGKIALEPLIAVLWKSVSEAGTLR